MLHCEVLQLPCTFYWLWIWLVWHGRDWSVCVCVEVGKMAKDIGMTIRKGYYCGTIPTLFGCFLGIPSLYVLSFLIFFCYLLLWGGERYEWCLDGLVVWGR